MDVVNKEDFLIFCGASSENDKIENTIKKSNDEQTAICEDINVVIEENLNKDNNSISNLPLISIDSSSKTIQNNASKMNPFYYVLRVVLCEGRNLAIRDVGGKYRYFIIYWIYFFPSYFKDPVIHMLNLF